VVGYEICVISSLKHFRLDHECGRVMSLDVSD
jgi:hypothetical protein